MLEINTLFCQPQMKRAVEPAIAIVAAMREEAPVKFMSSKVLGLVHFVIWQIPKKLLLLHFTSYHLAQTVLIVAQCLFFLPPSKLGSFLCQYLLVNSVPSAHEN